MTARDTFRYSSPLLRKWPLAAILLGMSLPFSAYAAGPDDMPPPHLHPHGTLLSFVTEGEAHATATQLALHLVARNTSTSPAEAQQKLNQIMQRATDLTKGQDGITSRAENYTLSEEYVQHGPKKWSARQGLTLSGTDTTHLLALAEKLQGLGLGLENVEWSLDPKTREALEQQARAEALNKIRPQAETDARLLGLRLVGFQHVRIGNDRFPDHPGPRTMLMMARMADAPTPPQSTPEEQSVHITVSVQAYLAPTSSMPTP